MTAYLVEDMEHNASLIDADTTEDAAKKMATFYGGALTVKLDFTSDASGTEFWAVYDTDGENVDHFMVKDGAA